nr:hypothetical protein Iba_chr11eCG0310 [Ipomoea batatas]
MATLSEFVSTCKPERFYLVEALPSRISFRQLYDCRFFGHTAHRQSILAHHTCFHQCSR